jgi:hypothetical protein
MNQHGPHFLSGKGAYALASWCHGNSCGVGQLVWLTTSCIVGLANKLAHLLASCLDELELI